MGELLQFPVHRIVREQMLDRKQLAMHYGRSIRWVGMQMKEGMPSHLRDHKRMFLLSETDPWLADRRSQSA